MLNRTRIRHALKQYDARRNLRACMVDYDGEPINKLRAIAIVSSPRKRGSNPTRLRSWIPDEEATQLIEYPQHEDQLSEDELLDAVKAIAAINTAHRDDPPEVRSNKSSLKDDLLGTPSNLIRILHERGLVSRAMLHLVSEAAKSQFRTIK